MEGEIAKEEEFDTYRRRLIKQRPEVYPFVKTKMGLSFLSELLAFPGVLIYSSSGSARRAKS
jgi:hypothetical protein